MKKALITAAGILVIAGVLITGAYLVGGQKIMTALNQAHLVATACDAVGAGCGGQIISIIPCAGTGIVAATFRAAGGTDASGPAPHYIFQVTKYLFGPPTHPGQWFVAKTTGQYKCMDPSRPDKALFTSPGSFFYGTSPI